MQKPLKNMAGHLKNITLAEMPETYSINPMFTDICDEEGIRKGVIALRLFLHKLYEYLSVNGDAYDKPKKIAHPFSDRVSLPSNYPFLHYMESVLVSIGTQGQLNEAFYPLTVDGTQFCSDLAKTPAVKVVECLRCLTDNGFRISGINLTEKKVKLHNVGLLMISYPENPSVLIGIKVMARAKEKFEGTGLYGVILRCDYRVIINETPEPIDLLEDMIKPLPDENRAFVIKMHQNYLERGFQCKVNIVDETCVRFFYYYRRIEIYTVIVSANNGYELAIRAKHTDEYADTVKQLHSILQEKIGRGYGCDKKRDPNSYCEGGCKGFRISLTNSISDFEQDIFTWINAELLCF